KGLAPRSHSLRDRLWKWAFVGPLVTTLLQTVLLNVAPFEHQPLIALSIDHKSSIPSGTDRMPQAIDSVRISPTAPVTGANTIAEPLTAPGNSELQDGVQDVVP